MRFAQLTNGTLTRGWAVIEYQKVTANENCANSSKYILSQKVLYITLRQESLFCEANCAYWWRITKILTLLSRSVCFRKRCQMPE